jgi:predicted enzyme related to lactoylglutathione lyase
MPDRSPLPGKFVWFEHASKDAKKAQAFFAEVFGWKVQAFPMGGSTYEMIWAGDTPDTMVGGYQPPADGPARWVSYVSVDDMDATVKAVAANGGKIVKAPYDLPQVGRFAHITDPQGAEVSLFKNPAGDPPDVDQAPHGRFFWNELHTTDPNKALAFYEKVVGYTHQTMPSPQGDYHVLNSKNGAGRGGVTGLMKPGVPPHWLPYVSVSDTDATLARAKKLGATIVVGAEDIPTIGRFAIFQDPTGAVLAIMKPMPRQK